MYLPLVQPNSTDWCWQYVTEVQAADASGTEKPTDTLVLPPGLHENIPEGEELTSISSSEETSSPPSEGLAAEIAYVTTIHVLFELYFLIHNSDMFSPFFLALDRLRRRLLLVVYDVLQSVFILLLYLFMVLSSPNS